MVVRLVAEAWRAGRPGIPVGRDERGRWQVAGCEHLGKAAEQDPEPGSRTQCENCAELGLNVWAHLRLCAECGHVGCCDSSPRRHATAHFHDFGHPVIRSFEPGESWSWCYVDERLG